MIKNTTRKSTLSSKTETITSFMKKARGLMFRPSLPPGQGLLMDFGKETRPGIWMLFMRFPIDLVFISNNKVVDLKENLRPVSLNPSTWKVFYPKAPARFCLELPAGTVNRTNTRISDTLCMNV